MTDHPHGSQTLERAGTQVEDASVAVVMAHGRGAEASSILGLAEQFDRDDVAYLAPQAVRNTWYPHPFTAPTDANEPFLSSALRTIGETVEVAMEAGVPRERIVLLGFSQGACLSLEYAARNATRYGGVVGLSGGLIGEEVRRERYGESMAGTPVFLGCSDRDPHIALERVQESTAVFEALEADVTERIYEGMGHTVVEDELEYVRELLEEATA